MNFICFIHKLFEFLEAEKLCMAKEEVMYFEFLAVVLLCKKLLHFSLQYLRNDIYLAILEIKQFEL